MTILVDGSAIVAIVTREPDAGQLPRHLERHDDRLYCATGAWEAVLAIARVGKVDVVQGGLALDRALRDLGLRIVPTGDAERRIALDAHRLYGKGTGHPARLNMGDCFAYACAKTNAAELLYKGDDFAHTDMA